jgi:hypothetical protein
MKSKALLVGAGQGFEGPWVSLEEGVWQVRKNDQTMLSLPEGFTTRVEGGYIYISGPVRLRASVVLMYKGPPVHLDARQISNGKLR